jgi:hypothetical protein
MTYEPIETKTLSTAAVSVTFSSVPSTYTDLIMVFNGVGGQNISLQFNGDTASNYSSTRIRGDGSSATTSRWTNITSMYGSYSSGRQSSIWQIQNYSNATIHKTALNRGGGPGDNVEAYVGLWRNTNAINSVTVIAPASTMDAGSTFTLYGIKAA